jgi:hypothetical protein
MPELKLPDISDEDKAIIASLDEERRMLYEEEADTLEDLKSRKQSLKLRYEDAVKAAHQNRMDKINADPALAALHKQLLQGAGA